MYMNSFLEYTIASKQVRPTLIIQPGADQVGIESL